MLNALALHFWKQFTQYLIAVSVGDIRFFLRWAATHRAVRSDAPPTCRVRHGRRLVPVELPRTTHCNCSFWTRLYLSPGARSLEPTRHDDRWNWDKSTWWIVATRWSSLHIFVWRYTSNYRWCFTFNFYISLIEKPVHTSTHPIYLHVAVMNSDIAFCTLHGLHCSCQMEILMYRPFLQTLSFL